MKAGVMLIVGALLLVGCQSTPEADPLARCDQRSLQSAIEMILHESAAHFDSLDQLTCSGEWALVDATITEEQTTPGKEILVFARHGSDWILKAPEIVCGSTSADGSRPSDAEIPADLWAKACLIP